MGDVKSSTLNQFNTPPQAGSIAGAVAVLPVTTTAAFCDLTTIPAVIPFDGHTAGGMRTSGLLGSYVTFYADTASVGIIFGPTKASVTVGNVPAIATAGTVSGATGAYTAVAGTCFIIPAGQSVRWLVKGGVNQTQQFIGYVGSGVGNLRIYESSPPGSGI